MSSYYGFWKAPQEPDGGHSRSTPTQQVRGAPASSHGAFMNLRMWDAISSRLYNTSSLDVMLNTSQRLRSAPISWKTPYEPVGVSCISTRPSVATAAASGTFRTTGSNASALSSCTPAAASMDASARTIGRSAAKSPASKEEAARRASTAVRPPPASSAAAGAPSGCRLWGVGWSAMMNEEYAAAPACKRRLVDRCLSLTDKCRSLNCFVCVSNARAVSCLI